MFPRARRHRRNPSTLASPIPNTAKVRTVGSGTAMMSKLHPISVLVAPPDISARYSVQIPFGFMPPKLPFRVAGPPHRSLPAQTAG